MEILKTVLQIVLKFQENKANTKELSDAKAIRKQVRLIRVRTRAFEFLARKYRKHQKGRRGGITKSEYAFLHAALMQTFNYELPVKEKEDSEELGFIQKIINR